MGKVCLLRCLCWFSVCVCERKKGERISPWCLNVRGETGLILAVLFGQTCRDGQIDRHVHMSASRGVDKISFF